jgi:hypothetical protein
MIHKNKFICYKIIKFKLVDYEFDELIQINLQ